MKPTVIMLPFLEKYRLPVLIWNTLEGMHTHAKRAGHLGCAEDEVMGYFIANDIKIDPATDEVKNNVIGYIGLSEERIGAGIFAHELQHFICSWILCAAWNLVDQYEEIALLTGELTRNFWIEFYRLFDVIEESNE